MSDTKASVDLAGVMAIIPKSRHPLAPLYEAITNALEAINQRQQKYGFGDPGTIKVNLYFSGLLDDAKDLERIEIIDNGIGFDDQNYERFEILFDASKGYNNRGSGRIQLLHRAERVEISSYYKADGKVFKRHFFFGRRGYITQASNVVSATPEKTGATVTMSQFPYTKREKKYVDELDLHELRNAIKSHYLLRLHLDKQRHPEAVPTISVEFFKRGKSMGAATIAPGDIPSPLAHGDIKVPYVKVKDVGVEDIEWVAQPQPIETLSWSHFKLPERELPKNEVLLCSKNVPVEVMKFDTIKTGESVDGHRFLTAIYGDVLNKEANVSHSVDRFTFPTQKETERLAREDLLFNPDDHFLFMETIEKAVERIIPGIYQDLFDRKKSQDEQVDAIAKAHGIPPEVARSISLNISDTEANITDKLYRKQAEALSRKAQKIKKVYEGLTDLNPTDSNYQDELEKRSAELLELIPQQNKEELSRYVIRRQMVTDVLKLILDNELAYQKSASKTAATKKRRMEKEGLIHDLIFKRRNKTAGGLNDLWVLSEEFVHFDGCSDVPISDISDADGKKLLRPISNEVLEKYQVKPDRRPDIFLYAEEAQCILVELKEPNVDLTDYLQQLPKYCNLIANFCIQKIEKFHCYLIGENFSPMDLGGDYRKNVSGDWVRRSEIAIMAYEDGRQEVQIASAHMEVMKLSAIHGRAHRRNKSFADKLGIEDVLGKK